MLFRSLMQIGAELIGLGRRLIGAIGYRVRSQADRREYWLDSGSSTVQASGDDSGRT